MWQWRLSSPMNFIRESLKLRNPLTYVSRRTQDYLHFTRNNKKVILRYFIFILFTLMRDNEFFYTKLNFCNVTKIQYNLHWKNNVLTIKT